MPPVTRSIPRKTACPAIRPVTRPGGISGPGLTGTGPVVLLACVLSAAVRSVTPRTVSLMVLARRGLAAGLLLSRRSTRLLADPQRVHPVGLRAAASRGRGGARGLQPGAADTMVAVRPGLPRGGRDRPLPAGWLSAQPGATGVSAASVPSAAVAVTALATGACSADQPARECQPSGAPGRRRPVPPPSPAARAGVLDRTARLGRAGPRDGGIGRRGTPRRGGRPLLGTPSSACPASRLPRVTPRTRYWPPQPALRAVRLVRRRGYEMRQPDSRPLNPGLLAAAARPSGQPCTRCGCFAATGQHPSPNARPL